MPGGQGSSTDQHTSAQGHSQGHSQGHQDTSCSHHHDLSDVEDDDENMEICVVDDLDVPTGQGHPEVRHTAGEQQSSSEYPGYDVSNSLETDAIPRSRAVSPGPSQTPEVADRAQGHQAEQETSKSGVATVGDGVCGTLK